MTKSVRRSPISARRLDYAAWVAKGYQGSEADAHLETGTYREGAGEFRAALGYFLAAVELEPANTTALRRAGELYLRLGYHTESLDMLRRAHHHGDGSAELAFSLGRAAQAAEEPLLALHHYDRSISLCDRDAAVYFHRGLLLRHLGNLPGATQDLKTATGLLPHYLQAHYELARVYAARDMGEEALAALRRIQTSRRMIQRARKEADLQVLRRYPSFWVMLSGKSAYV